MEIKTLLDERNGIGVVKVYDGVRACMFSREEMNSRNFGLSSKSRSQISITIVQYQIRRQKRLPFLAIRFAKAVAQEGWQYFRRV